jgi:hypothetical protein
MARTEEGQPQAQPQGAAEQSKSHHKAFHFKQIVGRLRCKKPAPNPTMSAQSQPQVPPTNGTNLYNNSARSIADTSQAPPENAAPPTEAARAALNAVAQTPGPQSGALQGYTGPICPADTRETVWSYSSTPAVQRPQGSRFAQNHWSFTMSGTIGSEAPHSEYFALDDGGRLAFDSAGRLPFTIGKGYQRSSAPVLKPAQHAAILPPPRPALASGPVGAGEVDTCSNCGGSASLKKFVTAGGNMRALCSDCVFDRCEGSQEEFRTIWAGGRPL